MEFKTFLLVAAAIGLEIIAQLSFKRGAMSVIRRFGRQKVREYLYCVIGNTWIRIGIIACVFEIVCAVAALTLAPLSVVFPLLSLSYCGVAVAGRLFLAETLEPRTRIGIVLITVGASMVSWASLR